MSKQSEKPWSVYIILSSDNSLYTGITNDVAKRWQAHTQGPGGAKYFRGRSPRQLVYIEEGFNRSTASKREAEIKKLSRTQQITIN